ncbi:MAG TPA: ferrous iron transport protein A [Anaerolineaceae bacterium]|jgi:ferrous iron transport protein A|nr:ferrous iron transport protein A [Anaerolineaceae bacterium]
MTGNFLPLSHLAKGDKGIVHHLNGGRTLSDRLLVMGFTKGAEISVMQNPGFGPVIVYVRDTRIALGRGEANKVIVEKLPL